MSGSLERLSDTFNAALPDIQAWADHLVQRRTPTGMDGPLFYRMAQDLKWDPRWPDLMDPAAHGLAWDVHLNAGWYRGAGQTLNRRKRWMPARLAPALENEPPVFTYKVAG